MDEVETLANNLSRVASYSGHDLGFATRGIGDPDVRGMDTRVILVNAKYRDLLVAALRAYSGGPQ